MNRSCTFLHDSVHLDTKLQSISQSDTGMTVVELIKKYKLSQTSISIEFYTVSQLLGNILKIAIESNVISMKKNASTQFALNAS